jgi:hypothetical protein
MLRSCACAAQYLHDARTTDIVKRLVPERRLQRHQRARPSCRSPTHARRLVPHTFQSRACSSARKLSIADKCRRVTRSSPGERSKQGHVITLTRACHSKRRRDATVPFVSDHTNCWHDSAISRETWRVKRSLFRLHNNANHRGYEHDNALTTGGALYA